MEEQPPRFTFGIGHRHGPTALHHQQRAANVLPLLSSLSLDSQSPCMLMNKRAVLGSGQNRRNNVVGQLLISVW